MTKLLFSVGATVGAVLLALLLATLIRPSLRIWPTPGDKSWQSYVWWPLFRGLNGLCFAVAIASLGEPALHGLPALPRAIAFAGLAASTALFLYAFFVLGRDNSYGASDGLVTAGIYQWSRNPQNAMLIVVYACLALAADRLQVYVLCAAMIAVYALMVFCEEPWLARIYGDSYARYCRQVPRFFNWQRLFAGSTPRDL